jgi:hypothetical protein
MLVESNHAKLLFHTHLRQLQFDQDGPQRFTIFFQILLNEFFFSKLSQFSEPNFVERNFFQGFGFKKAFLAKKVWFGSGQFGRKKNSLQIRCVNRIHQHRGFYFVKFIFSIETDSI